MTHAYRLCFNVLCTCLVLRHDQQRRRVNFLPKWLSSSILGWLGQNFERPSKKIRHLGRHILLKIHEPGGTKLKNLQYKKIFVVKNRKCANLPVLTIVSIGRWKSPAGTKTRPLRHGCEQELVSLGYLLAISSGTNSSSCTSSELSSL